MKTPCSILSLLDKSICFNISRYNLKYKLNEDCEQNKFIFLLNTCKKTNYLNLDSFNNNHVIKNQYQAFSYNSHSSTFDVIPIQVKNIGTFSSQLQYYNQNHFITIKSTDE